VRGIEGKRVGCPVEPKEGGGGDDDAPSEQRVARSRLLQQCLHHGTAAVHKVDIRCGQAAVVQQPQELVHHHGHLRVHLRDTHADVNNELSTVPK
jgi:hypothetical protein